MNQQNRTIHYDRIALVATGPLSGKSTLARYLHKNYGFAYAEHVRTLALDFVEHYNSENQRRPITVSAVFKEKEKWRVELQEHSLKVGFSDPASAGTWTGRTLDLSGWTAGPVVFDSFRGEVQADEMRSRGFLLVQLAIEETERRRRAYSMGKEYADVRAAMDAHPELETGIQEPDIALHSALPVGVLAGFLTDSGAIEYMVGQQKARVRYAR